MAPSTLFTPNEAPIDALHRWIPARSSDEKTPSDLKMSKAAGKIWMSLGALEYRECAGEDMARKKGVTAFPKIVGAKKSETVVFSWIGYKSRTHRDRVNAKVMKDLRIHEIMNNKEMPFDMSRMAYGGFTVEVNA